jgi:two-component system, sensor histidine kinase and response regulator
MEKPEFLQQAPQNMEKALIRKSAEFAKLHGGEEGRAILRLVEEVEKLGSRVRELEIFRYAVEQSPSAVVVTDLDGNIRYVNAGFSLVTGYTSKEVLGRNSRVLSSGEQSVEFYRELWDTILAGKTWRGVFHNRRKDGSLYWEEAAIAPAFDESGAPTCYIAVKNDITAQRELEGDLRRAKVDAEAANRAKSAFLATMSHEIRTPLNAVIGMASLLAESDVDEEQSSYAQTIVSASETLLELISDILDYSKIESRKLVLDEEVFHFEDAFLDPVEMFARTAMQNGVELTGYIDPALPEAFFGDRVRLKQILMNLLSNAVKFTASGFIDLSAHLLERDRDRCLVEFRLKDTGIGMSPATKSRLFTPFFQADTSITREFGGSGLGLAIVRQLVELMGGNIRVESEPGKGSEFVFTLRLLASEEEPSSKSDLQKLRGRCLLVVDDLETNRNLLRAFASKWGMKVRTAESAEVALQILREGQQFDAMVLDYQMPHVDGVSLAKQICEMPGFEKVPRILFTSAGDATSNLPEGLFSLVLHKPVRPLKLGIHISKLMGEGTRGVDAGRKNSLAGQRLLVAEDSSANRAVLRIMLEKSGAIPVLVENGEMAVERAVHEEFDSIILDLQMPVMDGFTALKAIKKHFEGRARRPRLLALTANAFVEDEKACMEAGFDQYLAKPVSISRLREALGTHT